MSNGDDKRFRSRKFVFAVFFAVVATLLTLYFGYLWKEKTVAVMGLLQWDFLFAGSILALYGGMQITDDKVNGRGG